MAPKTTKQGHTDRVNQQERVILFVARSSGHVAHGNLEPVERFTWHAGNACWRRSGQRAAAQSLEPFSVALRDAAARDLFLGVCHLHPVGNVTILPILCDNERAKLQALTVNLQAPRLRASSRW